MFFMTRLQRLTFLLQKKKEYILTLNHPIKKILDFASIRGGGFTKELSFFPYPHPLLNIITIMAIRFIYL